LHPQELQHQRATAEEVIRRIAAAIARSGRRPHDFITRLDARASTLSRSEVEQTLFRLEPNLSGYEREAVLVRLGLDRGNAVDFLDFCRILGGDLSITIDPRASSLPEVPVGLASQELLRQVSSELQRNGVDASTLFRSLDISGCGRLSAHDLNVMAQTFWPELTADELRDLYQTVCRNRSGYVELHEFCAALGFDPRASPASQETARSLSQLDGALQVVLDRIRISILEAGIDAGNLFQKLDVAGNGYLRHDEVSLMAYAFDPQLTGQQLDALFRHFDPRGCGMVDLEGFKRCLGFLTGTEQSNVDEAVRSRIAQSATSLQSRGCSVQEAFVIFDTNRNGFLDQTEFYRFLVSCDSRVSQRESDLIFAEVSRNSGRVDVNTFAQVFAVNPGSLGRAPPRQLPQVDQRRQMQAAQVCSWLEPAMLSHFLPLAGRDRINRTEFDRIVLTLEPQLAAPEVERLWRLHGPAPEMSLAELIHLNPTSGADSWAEAASRGDLLQP